MAPPHVLLYEPDQDQAGLLLDVFTQEDMAVTTCNSAAELEQALNMEPTAVVVTNTWDPGSPRELSAAEREGITYLASRTWVIVTSTRPAADQLAALPGSERITFVAKPYDLNGLLAAVERAVTLARRAADTPA